MHNYYLTEVKGDGTRGSVMVKIGNVTADRIEKLRKRGADIELHADGRRLWRTFIKHVETGHVLAMSDFDPMDARSYRSWLDEFLSLYPSSTAWDTIPQTDTHADNSADAILMQIDSIIERFDVHEFTLNNIVDLVFDVRALISKWEENR